MKIPSISLVIKVVQTEKNEITFCTQLKKRKMILIIGYNLDKWEL